MGESHRPELDNVEPELDTIELARWRADAATWRGRRPVTIVGGFTDTVAVATWTPENFAKRFPGIEVAAHRAGTPGYEPMHMARFVSMLGEDRPCFLKQHELALLPGLNDELDVRRAADPPYVSMNLFMGRKSRSPFHFDYFENIFVQVHGTKRFVIEPPDGPASRYMAGGEHEHFSQINPLAPDPARFPNYHSGEQRRVVLNPGDALYLPPGWFHDVTADDTSISANCWFGNELAA